MVAMNRGAVILALSLLACGCAGAASVAPICAPDASDEAGAIDAPDVPDVPAPPDAGDDRPAHDDRVLPIDPCDPVGVIDLGVVGLREGRTLRFDIPPARPPRRHDLQPPSGCGVDVPAHDLHVFRYTTMDAARLRVSALRFGAAPPTGVFPPASLWLLDECRPDALSSRCDGLVSRPFACPGDQTCDPEWGCFSPPRDGRESSGCRLTFPRCDDGLRCLEDRCVPPSPREETCQRDQYLDRTTFRYPCAPGQGCGRVCRSTEFERALCCVDDGSSYGFCRARPPLCDPGLKCVDAGAGNLRCVPDLDAGR
jgi:hypothetical protein